VSQNLALVQKADYVNNSWFALPPVAISEAHKYHFRRKRQNFDLSAQKNRWLQLISILLSFSSS